jgi:hypothetical protein
MKENRFHLIEHRLDGNIELMACVDNVAVAKQWRNKLRDMGADEQERYGYAGGKLTVRRTRCPVEQ